MTQYIFIDESGDPGELAQDNSNSVYYAELAIQLDNITMNLLCEHTTSWRYVKNLFREVKKLPRGRDSHRYLTPILELNEQGLLKCSCIYIDKRTYSGPYLKTIKTKIAEPLRFRNYIHRRLLEYHFNRYPIDSDSIELIFDRFEVSIDEFNNLYNYLQTNWNLPSFKYITHVDSEYCETLQFTGQLLNAIKDVKLGRADAEVTALLGQISILEIN